MTKQSIEPSNGVAHRRSFRSAAQAGEFLITAEVAPPKGGDPVNMIQMALALKHWVHAVNITDGSRAVLRMCPLAASIILLRHGIEPICQMTCRDRNRIALQADLLGANALGIRNILVQHCINTSANFCIICATVYDHLMGLADSAVTSNKISDALL